VASLRDRLREVLRVRGDGADAELDGRLLGVAQELWNRGFRTVGLLAASRDALVPPVALQLGLALSRVAAGPVAVVDAGAAWGAPEGAARDRPFTPTPITARLSLLTAAAPALGELEELVAPGRAPARRLLVDLGPYEPAGEHLAAMALLDGVVVVARAGRTKLPDVERRLRDVPAAQRAGVLLVEDARR
jgi:hypothetical protein